MVLFEEILFLKSSKPLICTAVSAVRDIAGHIYKFAFFLTRRALLRRHIGLQRITALFAFPIGHDCSLLSYISPSHVSEGGVNK
jgi:hypothetical protein